MNRRGRVQNEGLCSITGGWDAVSTLPDKFCSVLIDPVAGDGFLSGSLMVSVFKLFEQICELNNRWDAGQTAALAPHLRGCLDEDFTRFCPGPRLPTVAASPVFAAAGFSLGDVANAVAGAQGTNKARCRCVPSAQTAGLLGALTKQLNVTPSSCQCTGAMLGLAKNQLSSTDYSQLGKSVPGLDKLSVATL